MNSTFYDTRLCPTVPNVYIENQSFFPGQQALSQGSYFTQMSQNSFGSNNMYGFNMFNSGNLNKTQQMNQFTNNYNNYMLTMDSKSDENEENMNVVDI